MVFFYPPSFSLYHTIRCCACFILAHLWYLVVPGGTWWYWYTVPGNAFKVELLDQLCGSFCRAMVASARKMSAMELCMYEYVLNLL